MVPTTKQTNFLHQLKLPVQRSKEACACLLDFVVREGNPKEAKKRRALFRKMHERWVGHVVQVITPGHKYLGLGGEVLQLWIRTDEYLARIRARCPRIKNPDRFEAFVALGPKRRMVHLSFATLKRVDQVQQPLFL